MGKRSFRELFRKAKEARGGGPLSIKISCSSSKYAPTANYAGVIVYHKDDSHVWKYDGPVASGRGRSFYVFILDATDWSRTAVSAAGGVHAYLLEQLIGKSDQRNACCGGFALVDDLLKFVSSELNVTSNSSAVNSWESDGSRALSFEECKLVQLAVKMWQDHGPSHIFEVPASYETVIG
ncbi:hypothetical protein JKP88DRAFT_172191 [Tribonema minus]|uniref:Uncharacterized protein n=1 Tax=Tribonema minus TaxID=303371 RepID=A0A836C7G4_9STRA|nr:hypothetical protein JKP88DRAFT_172191 [Tribonema minus]